MLFFRTLANQIQEKLFKKKAIIVLGARQVGKTTLIKQLLQQNEFLFLDADDPVVLANLTRPNTVQLKRIIAQNKIIFIDEAQRIPDIGITLKIITDQFPEVQLIVSGSSSFDLGNQLNEPLTGRKWEYELFPLTWQEYENKTGFLNAEKTLEERLLYGFYPDVVNNVGNEKEVLKNLVNSYLYRDLLAFSDIRKPELLVQLLQALALQVSGEVNYNELSNLLGVNKLTIQKYIDILEKGYVIFRLNGFNRNLRNELKKSKKIYFYDNGVRNAIIGNFSNLELRNDKGALWENFLVSERKKQLSYAQSFAKMYFWRTLQKQEIDYVEEIDGKLAAFEFKWDADKSKFSTTFVETYQASTHLINRKNFREFVEF